jgi:hypothetical protein
VEPINFDPDTPEGPDQVPHGHLRGAKHSDIPGGSLDIPGVLSEVDTSNC